MIIKQRCLVFMSILLLGQFLFSCKNAGMVKTERVSILPETKGAVLSFRGYVTDEDEQLVDKIYSFDRRVVGTDSIDGHAAFQYMTDKEPGYFYTDDNATVWEYGKIDIAARITAFNFRYEKPFIISGWEIKLKQDEGEGTLWSAHIDTTFEATTMAGEKATIRYIKSGKARYDGWTETFLVEPYKDVPVMDANWYDLQTFILNETTGDTLLGTKGIAHEYFDPKLGAVKYISNYRKYEIGKAPIPLRGTWELLKYTIPE